MTRTDIAALLAIAAALMVGVGDVLEQRSAQQVTDQPVGTLALFGRLLRDRRWWAGSLVAGAGFGLQAAALGLGSVVLVQALLVTSLLFALLINAGTKPPQNHSRARDLGRAPHGCRRGGGHRRRPPGRDPTRVASGLGHRGGSMGSALILCLIGARIFSSSVKALLLGLMSGSLWGLFSVLTKGVVDQLDHGIPALLRMPELYVWVVVAIAATAWEQSAFRAGPLTASLPAVTVSEPIVGSVLGIAVLGETLNTNTVGWVAVVRVGRGDGGGNGGSGAQPGQCDRRDRR